MTKYRNIAFKNEHPHPLRELNQAQQQNANITCIQRLPLCTTRIPSKTTRGEVPIPRNSSDSRRLSLKKVFTVMSRMHHNFKLKYQTLFLAVEIYLRYHELTSNLNEQNPEEDSIPEGCLILVSMYLSMKFQEIYPPRLKNLFPFTKVNIDKSLYTQFQTKVLQKLGCNLVFQTAHRKLEDLLKESSNEHYYQAFYFMELAYVSSHIMQAYSLKTITKSIFYLMSPMTDLNISKDFQGYDVSEVLSCSKFLIQARNTHMLNDSTLNNKYSQERYLKVALKPWISVSLKS